MVLKPSERAQIELVATYIAALGLTSIRLASQADSPDVITVEVSPGLQIPTPGADSTTTILETFAFTSESHAELVAMTVGTTPFETHDAAREQIITAAEAVGAQWRRTVEVIGMAAIDIAEIELHLDALKCAGGLSWFNAQYKAYRKLCIATLTPAIQYSAYLHKLKLKMVELAAQNVAAGRDKFLGLDAIRMEKPAEIVRRDHFREDTDPRQWPAAHHGPRTSPLPGWSPRAPARHRE